MGIVSRMRDAVIAAGARTAVGRLLGSLSEFSAADLGGIVIKAALERAGVPGERVDYVIMGQVLQAGAGQIPSRQAAVAAGIPMSVPSLTINKVCLSGLDAIALAAQLIRAGEFDIVVAGGMESMTRAPHLLPGARQGFRFGSAELVDAMAHDGLTDAFDHLSMGESTERHNARLNISREEQDEFAARSHQRAAEAIKNGLFAEEIVAGPRAAAARRPGDLRHRRGGAGRQHRGVAEQAPPRVRRGRHHHRGLRLADLGRGVRGRGDVGGGGRGRRGAGARRGRRARLRRGPGQLAAVPAGQRHQPTRSARPG